MKNIQAYNIEKIKILLTISSQHKLLECSPTKKILNIYLL